MAGSDASRSERRVRGRQGLLASICLEDHGFSVQKIKEWREAEGEAGHAGSLEDFYASQGLCIDCGSTGVQMIGWSSPSDAGEAEVASEMGVNELPLYDVCPTCHGSGKADRAIWKRSK